MTNGEILTSALSNTFPIVKLMCDASESEKANLEATLGLLPEKFAKTMVKDGKIVLDNDDMFDKDGVRSHIVGPESELNSTHGIMKVEYSGPTFGSKATTNLEIVCDVMPKKGCPCEVLKYMIIDGATYKPRYRTISVLIDENDNISVLEELSDKRQIRGFTKSDYRSSYENE